MSSAADTGLPRLTPDQQDDASGEKKLVAWVRSHWALRMTIGILAVLLPLLVVVIVAVFENGLLTSISDSYHHRYANSVFIGSMAAFAAFLWTYDYKRSEDVWGNRAAIAAVGVAVFSTVPQRIVLFSDHVVPPSLRAEVTVVGPGGLEQASQVVHYVSAAFFFFTLTRFCRIWETDPDRDGHAGVYRWSRWTIYGGLAAIVVTGIVSRVGVALLSPPSDATALLLRLTATAFLVGEVVVVEAFGLSWLVRGSVTPRAAMRAVLGVSVALAVVIGLYTADQIVALDDPRWWWLRWASLALGVAGIVTLYLSLRDKLPGMRLRLTEVHDP